METWFERLTALDSLFLELEDRTAHMHVGAVALFDGPPPPYRDLLALIEARLDSVPRYRQRVQFVPFKQGRPVWVDESQFDLEYHVRHTALPSPGGEHELKKLTGRLLSQALDRDKPLWEMYLVEGLDDGKFAIVSKTHHCMLDGVSGVDLATVLMDTEPNSTPPAPPGPWSPRKAPGTAELLLSSMKDQLTHPVQLAREALGSGTDARKLLRDVAAGVFGVMQLGLAPASALNVPIGPHRRFEMVELLLDEVKQVRAALGGTVNDVVLATVAGALRSWLLGRGETLGPDLRVLVPVSVRAADAHGTFGNQVSAVFCPLPVANPNPLERLKRVSEEMKVVKESGQAIGAQALSKLGDFAPPTLMAQAARLQAVTRMFNLVVTNVPGPQFPLYLLGKKMLACYPQVPLAAQQAVGIALLSYDGHIGVGLLGDADAAKDLASLASAMRAALEELKACAAAHAAAAQAAPIAPVPHAAPIAPADPAPHAEPIAPAAPVPHERPPEPAAQADPARTPGI
jgi:diacylglycerol O-acyltransferase